ncbi:MAG: acyltransferase 3 [Alphaproteobacteria bacterium]|nr:acyltransferase 3 [Alphaproteobacteria bacterium]
MITTTNMITMTQEASGKKTNSQWTILAGLRFILAVFVSATHLFNVAPNSLVVQYFGGLGHAAVMGFFMISGYSIAASITTRPKGYLSRRFMRIYPAYLFAVVFCVLLMMAGPLVSPDGQVIHQSSLKLIVQNLLMQQAIWSDALECNRPLWTLGVEWWCYMAAPMLVRFKGRNLALSGLLIFLSIFFYCRFQLGMRGPNDTVGYYFWNVLFWVSTWVGGFAYYRARSYAALALMLAPSVIFYNIYLIFPYTVMLMIACAIIIMVSAKIEIKNKKIREITEWLGDVSYPYYLLHYPLLYAITTYTAVRSGSAIIGLIMIMVFFGYYAVTFLAGRDGWLARHSKQRWPGI